MELSAKSGSQGPFGPRPSHHLACGSAPGGSTQGSEVGGGKPPTQAGGSVAYGHRRLDVRACQKLYW
jgi:hypothetical protein